MGWSAAGVRPSGSITLCSNPVQLCTQVRQRVRVLNSKAGARCGNPDRACYLRTKAPRFH